MPLALVLALSMVMVVPLPVLLAMVSAPVSPSTLSTAATPPPPPPLVTQVGQVRLPLPSRLIGPEADTATVPVAFGMVMVLLLVAGVANVSVFVTPLSVAVRLTAAPCNVRFWAWVPTVSAALGVMVLTLSVPPMVTVEPLSVMMESPIAWLPVNLAILFVVPPAVVTPPPTPAQLPAVVQISYVPAAAVSKR